jgi:hypothetical protein
VLVELALAFVEEWSKALEAPNLARGGMPTGIAGRRIATMKMLQQGDDKGEDSYLKLSRQQ